MSWELAPLRTSLSSERWRRMWRRYVRETRRPLQCLVFLLPLVAAYEVGRGAIVRGGGAGRELLAHSMIQGLLGWFGVVGFWVPGVVLVAVLLVWHMRRRERWRVRGWVLGGMAVESLLLALPLLVMSGLFPPPRVEPAAGLGARLIVGLGAGIYEELVFRLLLIGALVWLFGRAVRLPAPAALGLGMGLAAVLFSLCHFQPVGWEAWRWKSFWFRLAAGLYLSAVFLGRGLGVSSGSHAAYNVLLAWLRQGEA